jgi:uncharacterized membrane protein
MAARKQAARATAARTGGTATKSKSAGNGNGNRSRSQAGNGTKTGNGGKPGTAVASRKPAAAAARKPSAVAVAEQPAPSGIRGLLAAPARKMGVLPLITLIITLYGFGASIYLTIAHYDTSVHLACSDTGLVNCQAVTTSEQSVVFGIFPVAVLGLAFYVFMLAAASPWGWKLCAARAWARWIRLGSVIVGMGFVLYLVYVELIQLNAICLWCTSVHVATFLIFVLLIFREAFSPAPSASAKVAAAPARS